jgi:hypothetical protein
MWNRICKAPLYVILERFQARPACRSQLPRKTGLTTISGLRLSEVCGIEPLFQVEISERPAVDQVFGSYCPS